MVVNNNVYNYLSSSLVPKKRNTTHKTSELHDVYTSMAKHNKNSPLYMFSLSEQKQTRMINIKESAITLKDVADSFADNSSEVYSKSTLKSSDTSAISGSIKSPDISDLPESLKINVSTLANEQVNVGDYLKQHACDFDSGTYRFTVVAEKVRSNFGLTVTDDDTNLDIQNKFISYINGRGMGITASLVKEGNSSAVMLSSNQTGISPKVNAKINFYLDDNEGDLIDILGVDNVSKMPQNSIFSINGEEHTSTSNHISINQEIELDFHKASPNDVTISFIPDNKVAIEQINSFADAFNSLVDLANSSAASDYGSRSLANDIALIAADHSDEFDEAGIKLTEDGKFDKSALSDAAKINTSKIAKLFSEDSSLLKDVAKVTKRLTLDPMAYIGKLTVTYPNTNNKLGDTYTQSLYSGLIYNNYI